MVVVEVGVADLRALTGLSDAQIENGLTELGAPAVKEKEKLVVELTPNRPDMFFIEGLARALLAYYKGKVKNYKTVEKNGFVLKVKRVESRPFVAAAVVKGVKLDENTLNYLIDGQEKLHETIGRKRRKVAIGLHNADAVHFPLVYEAVEEGMFIPLGWKQNATIEQIMVEHRIARVYSGLTAKPYPVVSDAEGIISLPPLINCERTRLEPGMENVLIETTGTHKETVEYVAVLLACTLADRGGTVYTVNIGREKTPALNARKMDFDRDGINALLGVDWNAAKMARLLRRLGLLIKGGKILIPPYRIDITQSADIAEDAAIAYGYDRFKPLLPDFFSEGKAAAAYEEISEIMRRMGFIETKTFTLTDKEMLRILGVVGEEVKNPTSSEYSVIKPIGVTGLLGVLIKNKMAGLPQFFYEITTVYKDGEERIKLCFCIRARNFGYQKARGYLQTLLKECGRTFELKHTNAYTFLEKTTSSCVIINKNENGFFGLLSEETKKSFGLTDEIYICEIGLPL